MNLVETIVEEHSEFESPLNFWRWAALCAISAVVKDNVWVDRNLYKMYPNIYVMFHADSGLKKGPPVNLAARLVSKIKNTTVIQGRSSIQGILKEMGTARTEPGGKISGSSSVFICSSEFSSSIVEDTVATTILTDLYDRNYREGDWKSLLKMESFSIKNPTVTMLSATNDAHVEGFFGKKDFQGGYFARTFIIAESKRNQKNSLVVPPRFLPDEARYVEYLTELSKLRGPFKALASSEESDYHCVKQIVQDKLGERLFYFSKAGYLYHKWYDEFTDAMDEQDIKDDTGTLNRFGDSVLKVAMLLSLAEDTSMELTENGVTQAISICERLVGNIRKATMGKKGMSASSPLKALIISELLQREDHRASRAILMKKYWMHFSSVEEWDEIMLSFDHSGMIKMEAMGNQVIYVMPPDQVKQMTNFLRGKN